MPEHGQAISVSAGFSSTSILAVDKFDDLLHAISRRGYEIIGPKLRDGAVLLDVIESADQLPRGWTDVQAPAQYRIQRRADDALFGYSVGAHSWKKFLHPPEVRLWSAERQGGTFRILNNQPKPRRPYAFLGVRACDLRAIAAQDRVFLEDKYRDPVYADRREGAFVVAVQCTHSASTCFCRAMGTGPRISDEYDLCLTELLDSGPHRFLVEVGSRRGAEVLAEIKTSPVSDDDLLFAARGVEAAASEQTRKIDHRDVQELLYQNFDHPRWDKIAARCLCCANCTMVCPTCFCTTIEDTTDVSGMHAERWRRWDSCFTLNFSYIHGGSIRASGKARYRQWITHKLAAWLDQFGTSGCVGCGRCITWCPAGIDITEEICDLKAG